MAKALTLTMELPLSSSDLLGQLHRSNVGCGAVEPHGSNSSEISCCCCHSCWLRIFFVVLTISRENSYAQSRKANRDKETENRRMSRANRVSKGSDRQISNKKKSAIFLVTFHLSSPYERRLVFFFLSLLE